LRKTRALFDRVFLPLLFLGVSAWLVRAAWGLGWLGVDGRIYYRASAAWLAGGDPWEAVAFIGTSPMHYAALPTMVILGAPFTILPEVVAVGLWIAMSAVATLYVVRTLRLPLYWLVFPPVVEGVLSANPSLILLALLVSGRPVLQAIAPMLKVYGVIPLLGERRWRALAWAAAFGALSLLAWPLWQMYLSDFSGRSARLLAETLGGNSNVGDPLYLAVGLLSIGVLALIDLRAAGWLAVPAFWPASQFHYNTLAMPVMHPILAVGLAIPNSGGPPFVIALYVAWRVAQKALVIRRKAGAAPPLPPTSPETSPASPVTDALME
jgi:hypothetical protein